MPNYLDLLARNAWKLVESGYYNNHISLDSVRGGSNSLREAVLGCSGNAIIAELKFASPSYGVIREAGDIYGLVKSLVDAGAVGLSVLTEPHFFKGSIKLIPVIRLFYDGPILMKDFVVSLLQVDAAYMAGADAVLLIKSLFDMGYCETGLDEAIEYIHGFGLEVLLEVHSRTEFTEALATDADLIGINNRNLETLDVDIRTTLNILSGFEGWGDRVVISESGITCSGDIKLLQGSGVRGFLVGTALMASRDPASKLKELVEA